MSNPSVSRICFGLFVTVCTTIGCYAQDDRAGEGAGTSAKQKLIEIAKARVEQHELRLKAIRALGKLKRDLHEVQVQQAQSQKEAVEAELRAAEVLNEQQRRELERTKQLVETAAAPQSKLAEMQTLVATAVARLAHARNNLSRVEISIRAAVLELEQVNWELALQEAEVTIELLDAKAELVRLESE